MTDDKAPDSALSALEENYRYMKSTKKKKEKETKTETCKINTSNNGNNNLVKKKSSTAIDCKTLPSEEERRSGGTSRQKGPLARLRRPKISVGTKQGSRHVVPSAKQRSLESGFRSQGFCCF
mmetsp:Transcript_44675/g.96044  ORF Transcript_44675/g.96044 Transcript_44675/m.96044 type:complete len:122 (+) Transcript_44675:735-1100(+)